MPNSGKLRLLYVISLPHSGSTILAHHLSLLHPLVNLGEAGYAVERLSTSRSAAFPCACGRPVEECEFWSRMRDGLPRCIGPSSEDAYARLIPEFRSVFGNQAILVDTNKTSEPLRYLSSRPDCEAFVVHLIRDVRGACVSEALRKKSKHPARAEWFTATQAAFQWIRKNHAIASMLHGLPLAGCRRIGYEALCQRPQAVLENLGAWVGASPKPGWQENHALIGNQLKFSGGDRGIVYDARWQSSRAFYPAFLLFPFLPWLNHRWVYS